MHHAPCTRTRTCTQVRDAFKKLDGTRNVLGLTTYEVLIQEHYLLLTTYCFLLTTYYSLLTTRYLPLVQ